MESHTRKVDSSAWRGFPFRCYSRAESPTTRVDLRRELREIRRGVACTIEHFAQVADGI
ncbi:MAG TPA: hypothetical protein VGX23_00055 [Actinocrinis sp.]|nr:hypothetical protein [Actinocrinis sp.]